jgi:hypothetical protein
METIRRRARRTRKKDRTVLDRAGPAMISLTVEDLGHDLKVMERETDPARKLRTIQVTIRSWR